MELPSSVTAPLVVNSFGMWGRWGSGGAGSGQGWCQWWLPLLNPTLCIKPHSLTQVVKSALAK